MKNRNYEIKVRLTQAEMVHLTRLVSASGLSREAYLRKLISGVVPREAPPPDFFAMVRELHYIGNNLNQIATKAHALNAIDAKHYDDGVSEKSFYYWKKSKRSIITRPRQKNGLLQNSFLQQPYFYALSIPIQGQDGQLQPKFLF